MLLIIELEAEKKSPNIDIIPGNGILLCNYKANTAHPPPEVY